MKKLAKFVVASDFRDTLKKKYKISKFVDGLGFSEEDQKWYGWSHRAICGFGIGSKVKFGDCAYVPKNKEDCLKQAIEFWKGPNKLDVQGEFIKEGGKEQIRVFWTYDNKVKNEKLRNTVGASIEPLPSEYGRGEWTAKTLDDAKQMAKDFAKGVS